MYIACGYTDLRRGIDGLAAMVQQEFSLDPLYQYAVSVLRQTAGPDQGSVLGGQRLCAAVQAIGEGQLSMAQK